MIDVVIGIGSNLGDREATIAGAIAAIGALPFVSIVAVSTIRETAPVGPPQPTYSNAAVRLRTELSPRALLDRLLAIERAFGRERREKWGPRTLDLDVLLVAGVIVDEPGLKVPHPELRRRRFALEPLVEVMPEAADPRDGARYVDVLAAFA